MASPLRTAFPTKDEYEKQVASYDAGRPNAAAPPKEDARFKPAESAGMTTPAPSRQPVSPSGPGPRWSMGEIASGVAAEYGKDRDRRVGQAMAIGSRVAGALKDFGEGMTEGRFIGQNPNVTPRPAMAMSTGTAQAATQPLDKQQPKPAQTELNAMRGDMANRTARANIEGLKAGESAVANPLPTPDQVRQTIRDKNGLTNNVVPQTARPGATLAATEATPRQPLPYNGAFAGGGDQAKAEDALFRRRMEVLKADQASGQASRGDYVSPFETNPNRRAELDAQQKKNIEDIASRQISEATVRMENDRATGLTSDRNLAMMPYEQRRAVINDRNALMSLNAEDKKRRSEEAVAAANRDAEMERAQMADSTTRRGQDVGLEADRMKETGATDRAKMTDATTRRGQDIEQSTNLTKVEIEARNKALDRENNKEVAVLRRSTPVDRVKIENIKAYNKHVSDRLTMNPELQNDPVFFESALKTFNLTAEDLKSQILEDVSPYRPDYE